MKELKYYCDVCKKETEKSKMLTVNIFPKVGGHKASCGSKDICKKCFKNIFKR